MDPEIGGTENTVYTSDSVAVPDPTGSSMNPYGQGFTTNRTVLRTASEGKSKISPLSGRIWVVSNPNMNHPYTKRPKGWKLMPFNSPPLLMHRDSPLIPKGGCFTEDVWVVPYVEGRIFPCGYYLNNTGLPDWVNADPNASIDGKDIVVYHMFGLTHIPRVRCTFKAITWDAFM